MAVAAGQPLPWLWSFVHWLKELPARLKRYFVVRFTDVGKSEAWGYVVWSAMAIVVGVPEIWAAVGGSDVPWPTISSTVGHLQEKAAFVALIPVGILVCCAYALFRVTPSGVVVQMDRQALGRTPEGRLTKVEVSSYTLEALDSSKSLLPKRKRVSALHYFVFATAVVFAGGLAAATSQNPWLLGYVLYGLIGGLWVVLPNLAAYWRRGVDVPFMTLFLTLRSLERRLHGVGFLLAAGLVILTLHLALYPWPNLATDSATHAGLKAPQARTRAEAELRRLGLLPPLVYSTQDRGTSEGEDAWFVYFLREGRYTGCEVIVSSKSVNVVEACSG